MAGVDKSVHFVHLKYLQMIKGSYTGMLSIPGSLDAAPHIPEPASLIMESRKRVEKAVHF